MKYEPPSSMLATFASTRALKLRLRYIEDLLFDEHNNQHRGVVVLLPTFPNLELLEIDAAYQYDYRNTNTAVATAALLRSCPTMSELRLRLAMHRNYCYPDPVGGGPFEESVQRFERLVSKSSAQRAAIQLDGVSELPDVFTTKSGAFRCLQKSLRKVTLQFTAKEVNCFQVQLAKFIVENAMVLEEMHIDDGSQFLPDHLLDKVERWRADAFQRRNLQPASFRAYQLASPVADSGKSFG
uniref:Uncharacterized protein n=1 Tax=Avena sativa TaxID=4498 RepID=A0ACD5YYQ7_AVESA